MSDYRTIKELVVEACINENAFPSYDKLTSLVLKYFPNSKWQKSHYAWYKSKIKRGEIIVPGFENSPKNGIIIDDTELEVEETIEASISLERDLHTYLSKRVDVIEEGLVLAEDGIEYIIDAGRIDILAMDKNGNYVVIELKAGKAKDNALGQILGYIGCLGMEKEIGTPIRGILVASEFDPRVVFAVKGLRNIKLVKYQVSFDFKEVT